MYTADPNRVTYFAETDFRGKKTRFGIKASDRSRHVYVIGKTGMGKSTLLENMAAQDIQNGEGVAFIDPHGKTADLLLEYVPEERVKDVIYFAPFDLENPISFNVMEDVGKDQRHLVANGLMASFKKIWPDVWSARMEYILGNILLALLEYPNSTLLGVNRMLADKNFREKVVENVSDPAVKAFWVDEFANYSDKFMTEAGAAIQNKIGQFTANPLIRNIVGQERSSLDLRKVMDEKKILIINLSKGRIGELNANLIGGMLITKLYLAAMSRANLNDAQIRNVPNFYLFVDEFQSFVNDSFKDILSEARKYKLNLTIAHQYIEQMPEEVRNAVFGNVGTTISFRVGPFDAEVLEKIFAPQFVAQDIVNLGFTQTYMTLMIDGVGSAPFSATTIGPLPPPARSYRDEAIAMSRSLYARPRDQVEADILKWHEPVALPPRAPRLDGPSSSRPRLGASREGASSRPRPASYGGDRPLPREPRRPLPSRDRLPRRPLPPLEATDRESAASGDQNENPRPISLSQLRPPITPPSLREVPPQTNALKDALAKAIREREDRSSVSTPPLRSVPPPPPPAEVRAEIPESELKNVLGLS